MVRKRSVYLTGERERAAIAGRGAEAPILTRRVGRDSVECGGDLDRVLRRKPRELVDRAANYERTEMGGDVVDDFVGGDVGGDQMRGRGRCHVTDMTSS